MWSIQILWAGQWVTVQGGFASQCAEGGHE